MFWDKIKKMPMLKLTFAGSVELLKGSILKLETAQNRRGQTQL